MTCRVSPGWLRLVSWILVAWCTFQGPVMAVDEARESSGEATASAEAFEWRDYQDPAEDRPEPGPLENALGILLRLGVVVGLAYGAAYLVKKGFIPRAWLERLSLNGGERGFRALASLPLRGNQTLHLVELGDRIVVVGSDGKDMLVKLAEWSAEQGSETFKKWLVDGGENPDFADEVEDTLRRLVRPQDGQTS
jgi:hypothetical protein